MRLYNAKFLDYTTYNQDQYAKAASVYQSNYIVSGFTMKSDTVMAAGELFVNGWQLTFIDDMSLNTTDGTYIYVTLSSQQGNMEETLYETTYEQGTMDAKVLQGTSLPSGAYPLYKRIGGKWSLLSNGRIDTINGKKANLSNQLTIDGNSINVINPEFNNVSNLNTALSDLKNAIEELTGGGLTEATAESKYMSMVDLTKSSITNSELDGLNFAQMVALIQERFPINRPTIVTGSGADGYTNIPQIAKELITDIYGNSDNFSYYSFVLTAPIGLVRLFSGGATLSIIGNQGTVKWDFIIDNYGSDYTLSNLSAFRPSGVKGGTGTFTESVTIGNDLRVEDSLLTKSLTWGTTANRLEADGKSMLVPSDFAIKTWTGSNYINIPAKLKVGNQLDVGPYFTLDLAGRFKNSKVGTRQIEFDNCSGVDGTKNIVLNHNNGALGGVLEWNRTVNGSNSCVMNMTYQSTGVNYAGFRAIQNSRILNFGTGNYLLEASTYLQREVSLLSELTNMQEELDLKEARIKLLELQMNAIINGNEIPTRLPETRQTNAAVATFRTMLENTQAELDNELYETEKIKLEDQISNLKTALKAVNVKRDVPASVLNYSNVLEEAEQKLAALEEANKRRLNEN